MDGINAGANVAAGTSTLGQALMRDAQAFQGMGAKAIAVATAKAGGVALLTGAIVGSQVGLAALGFAGVLYGGYKGGSFITNKVSGAIKNRRDRKVKEAFEKAKMQETAAT